MDKNNPAFYLKINRFDDFAIDCFMHWVEIADACKADIYVVIDNEEGLNKLKSFGRQYNTIPTYWDDAKPILDGLEITENKWVKCGSALITPFLHSVSNNIQSFWNIDADDTYIYSNEHKIAEALNKAVRFADDNDINMLQLDLHYTCFAKYKKLSTFGVSYTRNNVEYLSIIKKNLQDILLMKKLIGPWNIDTVFSVMGTEKKYIDLLPFYIEDAYLTHDPVVTMWHEGRLYFLNEPFEFWQIDFDEKIKGLPIQQESVKIDVGIKGNECKMYWQWKHPERLKVAIEWKKIINKNISIFDLNGLCNCTVFEVYLNILFRSMHRLVIYIASNDAHTPADMNNQKLRWLKAFGIHTNLEKTFRYSWLCVIDGGEIVEELLSKSMRLDTYYVFDGHGSHIVSEGFNSSRCSGRDSSIKIDDIEYGVNKRGLNFVIWDKTEEKVIDSVCFDTYNKSIFTRLKQFEQTLFSQATVSDVSFDECCKSIMDIDWIWKKDAVKINEVNANWLYCLCWVLDKKRPRQILELNFDVGTSVTMQYASRNESAHTVIDYDRYKVEHFINTWEILSPNTIVYGSPLADVNYNGIKGCAFQTFNKITERKKYDLILMKGPFEGGQHVDILPRLPEILCDDFSIIINHTEEACGKMVLGEIETVLGKENVECFSGTFTVSENEVSVILSNINFK